MAVPCEQMLGRVSADEGQPSGKSTKMGKHHQQRVEWICLESRLGLDALYRNVSMGGIYLDTLGGEAVGFMTGRSALCGNEAG